MRVQATMPQASVTQKGLRCQVAQDLSRSAGLELRPPLGCHRVLYQFASRSHYRVRSISSFQNDGSSFLLRLISSAARWICRLWEAKPPRGVLVIPGSSRKNHIAEHSLNFLIGLSDVYLCILYIGSGLHSTTL